MPDISSNSLDVDDLIRPEEKVARPSPFDVFAEESAKAEDATLAVAARMARKQDPEAYAEAQRFSGDLSPELALRQSQLVKEENNLAAFRDIFARSPEVRGYFARSPEKLPLAKPDELDAIVGLSWLWQAGVDSYQAGWDAYYAAQAGNRIARGEELPGDRDTVARYNPDRTFGAKGFWQGGYTLAAQQLSNIAVTIGGSIKGAVYGGAGGAALGSVAGGVGAAPGAVVGASIGSVMGAYSEQQGLQTGLSRIYFQKLKDENGKPLEPELVELASALTGSGGAALEQVGLTKMIRVVPGGERILGFFTKEGMTAALRNPTTRQALLNFAKNIGSTAGTEVTTEVLQQSLQILAEESAKVASEGEFKPRTVGDVVNELVDTAYQTAQVMAILGPVMSSTRFGADVIAISRSRAANKSFDRAVDALVDNGFVKRAPGVAAEVIDAQLGGMEVHIPADRMAELFQSEGRDLYGPAIPNWRQRVDEALATGGDVTLTAGEYIAFINQDPKNKPLRGLLRMEPGGYTTAELAPSVEAMDNVLMSEAQRAQQAAAASGVSPTPPGEALRPEGLSPEFTQFQRQLAQAGFSESAASQYSTLMDAFFKTMSARTGRTVGDLFNEFGVSVRSDIQRASFDPPLTPSDVGTPRGSLTQDEQGAIINLFGTQDMSTVLHESSHFFLAALQRFAAASPDLQEDLATIYRELGSADGKFTREQEEQFAKWGEAYFYKGKAPSKRLERVFATFRGWLKTLYRNLKTLGAGRMSRDVSDVFDRMFATDLELAQLEVDTAFAPVFQTADEMGVTAEQWLDYQRSIDEMRTEAQGEVYERVVGQVRRRQEGWRKEMLTSLRQQAEEELAQQPPYKHQTAMKEGRLALAVEELAKRYPGAAEKFPRRGLRKDGLPLDVAAELLGYPTADEMVYDFVQTAPLREAALSIASDRLDAMLEGKLDDANTQKAAVAQAMANDPRVSVLGAELEALSQKANKTDKASAAVTLARQVARTVLYGKSVREVRPDLIQAAHKRAGARAFAALASGDYTAAADWKRKQLFAAAMLTEAKKLDRTIEAIRTKARRYSKKPSKSIDPAYMEQIRALVEKYEFIPISDKKLRKRKALAEFIQEATEEGLVVTGISDRLLRDTTNVNYSELSVEDLLSLGDTLDNLEHLGRMKNRIVVKRKAVEFANARAEVINRIQQAPARKQRQTTYAEKEQGLANWRAEFLASLLKPEQIIEWLDMGDIAGPMNEYVFQPIADAQGVQNTLNLEYNKKLTEIFEDIPSSYLSEVVNVPELGTKFTREQLLSVALNTGTESNRSKLLEGELWTPEALEAVLSRLSEEDWRRVQQVWDLLDTLWPKIAALEKKLTGVAPPRVEARSFTNQFGDFRGGYYPVVYDFTQRRGMNLIEDTTPQDQVLASGLFNNANVTPGTSHKFTVKRQKVAKPIDLSLSVLPSHIHTVTHDLAYREAVRGAYKILWDPSVRRAIEDTQGRPVYEQLQHWLRAVASERPVERDATAKALGKLRTGATMYSMGYSLTTALAQPLGFFNSLVRVGVPALSRAIYQMTIHPWSTLEFVNSVSTEMRDRFNTQDRDLRAATRKLTLTSSRADIIRTYAFHLIGWVDKYVATATWTAAYQEGLTKNGFSEELARQHADRTVRLTQGTGHVKDMAKIMNSGEINKLFTMFYSFFSAQYNAQVDLTRKTARDMNRGDWGAVFTQRLPQWAFLVACPAIFGALLSGQTPEEDENVAAWALRKILMYPLTAVPFVRDIAGHFDTGFDYRATAGFRAVESLVRFGDKVLRSEPDLGGAAKAAAEAASIAYHIPSRQAILQIENLWKGLENGDFQPSDILYGRQGR